MICIIALIVFSILGIFSATHRALAKEALDCVFRRVTFRPCNTGFKEKIKSKILTKLLNRSALVARITNRYFELFSWLFFILMITSTFYAVRGVYNYYLYGSCNGLNESGFCAFDPKGENNKVTQINQTCGAQVQSEENVVLDNLDLSNFPQTNIGAKNTVFLVGCYECEYTRKAYPDIQRLVREQKTNYIFAHYPAKEDTNYLSEIGHCVYREYGDSFWAFNDYLFTVDKVAIYDQAYMERILSSFNFDANKISECAKNPETIKIVAQQVRELQETGLYGTPTVFINGRAFVGPKPYRVYRNELKRFILF